MGKLNSSLLRKSERGFTLAEIAITLAVVAILATTATIKMGSWDRSEKLRSAQLAVYQILQQTRIQAITRGATWGIANTLTTTPFHYETSDATLTNFVQAAVGDDHLTVSEDNIAFTPRGRRDNLTQTDIIITGSDPAQYKIVRVGADGLVTLVGSTG